MSLTPAPRAARAARPSIRASASLHTTSPVLLAFPAPSTSSPSPAAPKTFRSNPTYPARKQYLTSLYSSVLSSTSPSGILLLLQHNGLAARDWSALRATLSSIPLPFPSTSPAQLLVARTGVLAGLARRHTSPTVRALEPLLTGPIALLASPTLDPPYLKQVLAALDKASPRAASSNPRPFKPLTPAAQAALFPPYPATPSAPHAAANPRMLLLGGIVQDRLLPAHTVRAAAQLPDIDTVRGQLVGLVGSPAQQMAGVLSMAGGGAVARALEGYRLGLEKGEKGEGEKEA